jgi:hypothetical protein
MPYIPVQRIVTVEFVNDPRRKKEYDVRITPERVVVRDGDTIAWDVQGLPRNLAKNVSFGDFELIEPAPRVRSGKRGLQAMRTKELPGWSAAVQLPAPTVRPANRKYRATLSLDKAGLGYYKYAIKFGTEVIIDPEAEIRGPK